MGSTLKPVVMERDSYVMKLAEMGGVDSWDIKQGYITSCDLNKAIFKGAFALIFVLAVLSLISTVAVVVVSDFLAFIVSGFINGWCEPNSPTVAMIMLSVVGIIFGLIWLIGEAVQKSSKAATHTELYRSWKDKYCRPVTLKE